MRCHRWADEEACFPERPTDDLQLRDKPALRYCETRPLTANAGARIARRPVLFLASAGKKRS
jgi:hypothetical protein